MPAREIVDLLSTDDEAPKVDTKTSKTTTNLQTDSGYGSLSDKFIDVDNSPRKRRRLTPAVQEYGDILTRTVATEPAKSVDFLPKIKALDSILSIDDDDDPIVWTSSPKQNYVAPNTTAHDRPDKWTSLSDSDESLPDEQWLRAVQQRPAPVRKGLEPARSVGSYGERAKRTEAVSRVEDKETSRPEARHRSKATTADDRDDTMNGTDTGGKSKHQKARRPKLNDEEKAARAQEKEEAKVAAKHRKTREKEEEKERRRLLKEEQARERKKEKDRAEVGKLKLDKKLSTPEMIVDLPISIDGSTVDTQIRESLKNIGVETTSYQSPIPHLIKWRRKVEARVNPQTGHRERLPAKEIDTEKHVMYLMSSNECVELATGDVNGSGQSWMNTLLGSRVPSMIVYQYT